MREMMELQDAAVAMNGILLGANAPLCGVSTDSRSIVTGELFIALRGDTFDGHEFINAAKARGACAAVVDSRGSENLREAGFPLLVVEDTRLALGALAADWRKRFNLPVIAVTGSNGKTTSKEMIASIMKVEFGENVLATQGNLNNDIGLPLTLLKLRANHQAAIIEMGMNHPREIAYLARITSPTVALVTNAQRAHLAGMGSIEMTATEKGSVFTFLDESGIAVINGDDQWADLWRTQCTGRKIMSFAFEQVADVTGHYQVHGLETRLTITANGEQIEVALALPGGHNARNALGVACVALAVGVPLADVQKGLSTFTGIKGRLQRRPGLNGAILLDDSYNANPDSVRAGIDVLATTIGKKILVLGDMGEIGDMTGQFHDEVGVYAKSQGLARLLALGESSALASHSFGVDGQHFKKIDDLIESLSSELTPDTIVLIKGSRFMRMERVTEAVATDNSAPVDEAATVEGGK